LGSQATTLKGNFRISFAGEEGVGAGVRREWFRIISQEMFNPDNALFKPSANNNAFQPNPQSYVNPDHLSYFHFVGRVIGMAIYHEELLDVFFTRSFYKHVLGIPVNLDDLESVDFEYHKNLKWILENDTEEADLDLAFCADIDNFGEMEVVELKPNGKNIPVTEANKAEYVQLIAELKLTTSIIAQLKHFLTGFNEIIPRSLISIFNEYELELLISGIPKINTIDWQLNTEYAGGYTDTSCQIEWFWKCVRSFSYEGT
jgi:hypothetical protein